MRIRFKSAWKDGTHSVLLEPLDFVSRLRLLETPCALIPPPRFHMLRYHGLLAGHSRDRAEVVPQQEAKDESSPTGDAQQLLFEPTPPLQPSSRHPWAYLLRRVFAIDIMTCPECQAAMRVKFEAFDADSSWAFWAIETSISNSATADRSARKMVDATNGGVLSVLSEELFNP